MIRCDIYNISLSSKTYSVGGAGNSFVTRLKVRGMNLVGVRELGEVGVMFLSVAIRHFGSLRLRLHCRKAAMKNVANIHCCQYQFSIPMWMCLGWAEYCSSSF